MTQLISQGRQTRVRMQRKLQRVLGLAIDEIRKVIRAKGLTNLCVPREVRSVREIPKLGTGKVNYRDLQKLLDTADAPAPAEVK